MAPPSAELRRRRARRRLAELHPIRTPRRCSARRFSMSRTGRPRRRGMALAAAVGGDDVTTTLRTAARQRAGLPRLQILEAL
ncbi:MAG: hypothetical protein IPG96_06155 [Proteobacteria bacterium]|nr:hypothetical protein [Pseudomonadota bacterium]